MGLAFFECSCLFHYILQICIHNLLLRARFLSLSLYLSSNDGPRGHTQIRSIKFYYEIERLRSRSDRSIGCLLAFHICIFAERRVYLFSFFFLQLNSVLSGEQLQKIAIDIEINSKYIGIGVGHREIER